MNKVVKKKFRQHLSKIFILIITCFLILKTNFVFASEVFTSNTSTDDVSKTTEEVTNNITESTRKTYNLDEYIDTINNSVNENLGEEIDFKNIANELLNKNDINHKNLFTKLLEIFVSEVSSAIKGTVTIFIIVIIMAILSNLDLIIKVILHV